MIYSKIKCPFCAEEILSNDTQCKFCEEDLTGLTTNKKTQKNEVTKIQCSICKGENHERAIICKHCNVRLTPLKPAEKFYSGLNQLSNLLYIAALFLVLFTLYKCSM